MVSGRCGSSGKTQSQKPRPPTPRSGIQIHLRTYRLAHPPRHENCGMRSVLAETEKAKPEGPALVTIDAVPRASRRK